MSKVLDLVSTAASLGGVALANKVLAAGWKQITGNEPPAKNPDPDEAWRDIIIWSLISGLAGTVIKVAITRRLAQLQSDDDSGSSSSQAGI